jgi:hypothetical protein
VLVPAVVDALKKHDKVRLYYETAADFTGIDPQRGMDRFQGRHGTSHPLERVAVVTDVEWIKHTMNFFSFMLPDEMRLFPLS